MNDITSAVKKFYNEMPFNMHKSMDSINQLLEESSPLDMFPILKKLDLSNSSIIEVGCGVGWFTNFLAYHFKPKKLVGLDFSVTAIERAQEDSKKLNTDVQFMVADLFEYQPPEEAFDIVISNGVLHCTKDCLGAVEYLCTKYLKPGGHICLGLYHLYGRKPFLDHFAAMKISGASEEELFVEYCRLHSNFDDETYIKSWFRDQVLHPYETQHTVQEIADVFTKNDVKLKFNSVPYKNEHKMSKIGRQHLAEGNYFPGFFTCTGKKNIL